MRVTMPSLLGLTLLSLASAQPVLAQTAEVRLTIDPKTSLAWWQLNPHLNHLWATTCPAEPSWRPGEGRSLAWATQYLTMRSKTGYAAILDTIIPLYPRRRARPLCEEAVSGEITATDTTAWQGVHGFISVRADALTTGLDMRDTYARKSILNTASYPTIRFDIDSVAQLQKVRGDTLKGFVYGKFTLHGVAEPVSADLRTWREAGGRRVKAHFMVPAEDMTGKYGMSKMSLGLGVGGTVWKELHMGVDVVLVTAASGT